MSRRSKAPILINEVTAKLLRILRLEPQRPEEKN